MPIVGSQVANMSGNKDGKTAQFRPMASHQALQDHAVLNCPPLHPLPCLRRAALGALTLLAVSAAPAWAAGVQAPATPSVPAESPLSGAMRVELQRLAQEAALVLWGQSRPAPRVEVLVGNLPTQLKLAPCSDVVPYLPHGVRPLGRSRLGLRCNQGSTRWNVFVPVTVRLWAPSLVADGSLPAGTQLEAGHLTTAEVDLAERSDAAIGQIDLAVGRTLQRGLRSGEALRQGDLRARQLFAAGDTVRIVAVGAGYAISSEGQAIGPGLEGQSARVRTDSGRIITGTATAVRRVEVAL